jgi:hypothetical protein
MPANLPKAFVGGMLGFCDAHMKAVVRSAEKVATPYYDTPYGDSSEIV